jgi:murein DD-endopeptidase MepM/ murein hydrolase activator NlpD
VLRVGTPESTTFGNSPVIDHGPELRWRFSVYAHAEHVFVRQGMTLPAGAVLGLTGSTGLSFGEHCHWQLSDSAWFPRDFSRAIDPSRFIVEEDPDMTLAEDHVMADYATDDEKRALLAGTMTRESVLAAATSRCRMILRLEPEAEPYRSPFWSLSEHVSLPKHGGAASTEHTHDGLSGEPLEPVPHTHTTGPPEAL